jgi:hypothetical protein
MNIAGLQPEEAAIAIEIDERGTQWGEYPIAGNLHFPIFNL